MIDIDPILPAPVPAIIQHFGTIAEIIKAMKKIDHDNKLDVTTKVEALLFYLIRLGEEFNNIKKLIFMKYHLGISLTPYNLNNFVLTFENVNGYLIDEGITCGNSCLIAIFSIIDPIIKIRDHIVHYDNPLCPLNRISPLCSELNFLYDIANDIKKDKKSTIFILNDQIQTLQQTLDNLCLEIFFPPNYTYFDASIYTLYRVHKKIEKMMSIIGKNNINDIFSNPTSSESIAIQQCIYTIITLINADIIAELNPLIAQIRNKLLEYGKIRGPAVHDGKMPDLKILCEMTNFMLEEVGIIVYNGLLTQFPYINNPLSPLPNYIKMVNQEELTNHLNACNALKEKRLIDQKNAEIQVLQANLNNTISQQNLTINKLQEQNTQFSNTVDHQTSTINTLQEQKDNLKIDNRQLNKQVKQFKENEVYINAQLKKQEIENRNLRRELINLHTEKSKLVTHTFILVTEGNPTSIHLAGSFNNWLNDQNLIIPWDTKTDEYKMQKIEDAGNKSIWRIDISLPTGTHEFKYIINHNTWVNDPYLPKTNDRYQNSIITISPQDSIIMSQTPEKPSSNSSPGFWQ